MRLFLIITIITYIITGVLLQTCNNTIKDEFDNVQLGIVISPLNMVDITREIVIYWKNPNIMSEDVLGLYKKDPKLYNDMPLFRFTPDVQDGFRKTGLSADFIPTKNLIYKEQCLNYCVAWIRNDVVRKSICLSTHPNWMKNRRKTLGHLNMREVFLPGTHDSSAFVRNESFQPASLPIFESDSHGVFSPFELFSNLTSFGDLIPDLPRLVPDVIESAIDERTITQDEDVLAQLIYGARYLDIRVGRYPNDKNVFWGNHGPIKMVPLKSVINDVKSFLDNTNEIIIFDVQEFPAGFKTMASHYELIDFLEKEFAGYFLRRPAKGWSITLDEIWNSNRRLIIGYDDGRFLPSRSSVWQAVRHQWGDVRTIESLYNHLNKIETQAAEESSDLNPLPRPRAAMAELTPNINEILIQNQDLRQMAEMVNINVTKWYSEKWQHTANVVAVDFLRSSDIVETAIKWNDKRAAGC